MKSDILVGRILNAKNESLVFMDGTSVKSVSSGVDYEDISDFRSFSRNDFLGINLRHFVEDNLNVYDNVSHSFHVKPDLSSLSVGIATVDRVKTKSFNRDVTPIKSASSSSVFKESTKDIQFL